MGDFLIDGTQIPCSSDATCPYTSICYFPDKANPTQGLCGCNAEWGEIGSKCDKPGAAAIYRVATYSFLCSLALLVMIFIIYELFRLHMSNLLRKFDARVTTLIAFMISLGGMISYFLFGIYMSQHPMDILNFQQSGTEFKKRPYESSRSISLGVLALFFIAGILNVSVLWLEIAIASKKFKRIFNFQISRRYSIALFVFDVLLAIGTIVLLWLTSAAAAVAAIGIVVIIVIYSYSVYAINDAFNGSASSDPKSGSTTAVHRSQTMKQSLINIRKCSTRVLALMVIWVVCLIVTAVRFPKMRTTVIPRGQIQDFVLTTDIGYLLMISAIAVTVNYLHKPSKTENTVTDSKHTAPDTSAQYRKFGGSVTNVMMSDNSSVERDFPKLSINDA